MNEEMDRDQLLEQLRLRMKFWRTVSFVLLLALWAIFAYFIILLPDQIPTKFSASGEIAQVGSKWTMLMMPVICTVFAGIIPLIRRFPKFVNTPVRITEENREIQMALVLRFLAAMTVLFELLFGFLMVQMAYPAQIGVATWMLFIPIGLIFASLIHYIVLSVKYQ